MLTIGLHFPSLAIVLAFTRNPTVVSGAKFASRVFPVGVGGASWNV
jgi:hypothetical protein